MKLLNNVFNRLLKIIFPPFCVGCGRLGKRFCKDCFSKLRRYPNTRCFYCKKPSLLGFTHPRCEGRGRIDGLVSFFYYDKIMRGFIKTVKYRLSYKVLEEFLALLYYEKDPFSDFTNFIGKEWVIVPIPLHKKRFIERGFNQAELIAEFIAKKTGMKVRDLLLRKKDNPPQALLKRKLERHRNTLGLFSLKEETFVKGNIILVDDVVTTGKTVEAAARVLKKAGANQVVVFTLAKG